MISDFFTRFSVILALACSTALRAADVTTGSLAGSDSQKNFAPVHYIQPSPAHVDPPIASGNYENERFVPDTCDLEEAARRCVDNYMTKITEPKLDYEPYNRGRFDVIPPRLTLDIGSYLCAWPKYREALPLLRLMCGSRESLEIDAAWAEHILKCIGPDGLFYVPREGRPWDDDPGNRTHTAYWWPMQKDVPFYTHLSLPNGRLLGGLAVYYQMTGNNLWKKIGNGVVDRMNQLAVRKDNVAFFSKFNWLPGEELTPEQRQQAIAAMDQTTTEETDKNTCLWQTWIIVGLAQYYEATGYEPARDLARGLVNYLRKAKYIETWTSHFHCITLGIHGMAEFALATHDRDLAEYARKAYDFARSGPKLISLPDIGYFVNQTSPAFASNPKDKLPNMEGCSIGDMTAIAVKLTELNMGDEYWEDVDRYTRNILTAIQRISPEQGRTYFEKHSQEKKLETLPVAQNELADQIPERMVGTFAQAFYPNDMFASTYFDSCCIGNVARALYYVWQSMIQELPGGTLKINLLLNRTSPAADIDSEIPYRGRVQIQLKRDVPSLTIRMNDWIEKPAIKCRIDGTDREFSWKQNYLDIGAAISGQTIEILFPIQERKKTLETHGFKFDAVFRGNDCVDLRPQGSIYPLFQRDKYRDGVTKYIKVKRFSADHPIIH